MINNLNKFVNTGVHAVTLGSRFIFIFFLAKYLNPELIGFYGIFTATVGYSLYIVGLDFYTYVSREIIKVPPSQRGRFLKGQAALSGCIYIFFVPLVLLFLGKASWPGYMVWWFFPILLLEHFNQEISRLLVALSDQLAASLIIFVRQGSWALAIILLMSLNKNTRTLEWVMGMWMVAGLFAAGLGFWRLKKLKTGGWRQPIDWVWIKKGFFVSTVFMVATLALRGVQTFDRYWLEALGSIELVAAYVLLLGVAGTLLVFLDAAVFSFAYPILIQYNHKGEHQAARKKVKQMFIQTICISVAFGFISWLLLPYLLTWIGNTVYLENIHWYLWVLSAVIINSLGLVPHYALYARGKDRVIVYSHIFSLFIFCLATWYFSFQYSAFSVVIGLNMAFFAIFIWKLYAYIVLIKEENSSSFAIL